MRRALAVVLLAVLVAGGCGIPDDSPVQTLAPGPSTDTATGGEGAPPLIRREDSADKGQFVLNYLQAAAGDPEGALQRARAFFAPGAASRFTPRGRELTVVRRLEEPLVTPGRAEVGVRVQPVGTLDAAGILEPATDTTPVTYTFTVGELENRPGLFLSSAPKLLLLSDTALTVSYDRRTVYFWNIDHTGLIPDVRYMPRSVPRDQQPTEIINWLTGGPAPWLAGAAEPLPSGTALVGVVPAVMDDRLQINLSGQALRPDDPRALDRLRRQLMWSLRPNLPSVLELKIGHQDEGVFRGTDYLSSNPAYRVHQGSRPERFAVAGGQVRRLARSADPGAAPPLLTPRTNRNVRLATFGRSATTTYAALVVTEGRGQALKVGAARGGGAAAFRTVALPAPIGRPAFAATPDAREPGAIAGLVPAGGRLYGFTAAGAPARAVEVPGATGPVTDVAVAPDARRVALVAGGRLYETVLTGGDDGPQLSTARAVSTPMREVTAVAWSSEGWLAVAGVRADNGRNAILYVTVDGALSTELLRDIGADRVTYLVADPADPTGGRYDSGAVAYVAGGAAYDVLTTATRITAADLLGEPVGAGGVPQSPFFLD